ncbi:hypothetical protein ACFYTS_02730 [Nocardia sp. NPDC004151]|uniref:hypothetical protein n=1 Tax=Nocardia sp. NPDC004151 TaxID=3364304 RepID=UPI0036C2B143
MSWDSTHEWWRALHDVAAEIESRRDGELPWRPEHATVFGDPDGLIAALRYRWKLTVQAHEEELAGANGEACERELVDANQGVLRVLRAAGEREPAAAPAFAAA